MTGRICLASPEYSPMSSSPSVVLSSSSRRHCRAATMLVTRISVLVRALAITPIPTTVLPAPHGSTTTPLPPDGPPAAQNVSTDCSWNGRSANGSPPAVTSRSWRRATSATRYSTFCASPFGARERRNSRMPSAVPPASRARAIDRSDSRYTRAGAVALMSANAMRRSASSRSGGPGTITRRSACTTQVATGSWNIAAAAERPACHRGFRSDRPAGLGERRRIGGPGPEEREPLGGPLHGEGGALEAVEE